MSRRTLYPWVCWFLASSFIFYKYVLQVSPSVMVPELMNAFSLTGQSLGALAACYFYAYLVMQFPVGLLLDRFSPRYLITVAIIVCAMGAWLFGHANSLLVAQWGRILIGVGGAFSAVGAMKIISVWFPAKRFAMVSGLMMSMAMLGAILGESPLSFLVAHQGWRSAINICATAGIVLALLVWLFIRDNKQRTRKAHMSIADLANGIKQLLKNKQTWLISAYSGLAFAPISAFAGLWGVPFIMQQYGYNRGVASAAVSMSFIGFAIGSPLSGWLSDRICRRKPIMIIGTSVTLITFTLIVYGPILSKSLLTLVFIVFGFFTGFFFVSFAHVREINRHDLSATSIGFINMFDALLGALSEPLIGKMLDLGWSDISHDSARVFSVADYHHALIVLPVMLCAALALQLFIKETHCQALSTTH